MLPLKSSVARAAILRPAATFLATFTARFVSIVARTLVISSIPKIDTAGLRTVPFTRLYSVLTHADAKFYRYEDIKALVNLALKSVLLVDVREPSEYAEGHIPGAVNVPFKSSPGAFGLSAEEFQESFGFPKPDRDTELVFYCLGGVRSSAAEELANSFGYAKRGNYAGSYEDWISKQNA